MSDFVAGKTIIVTGAGGGFGRLISQKAAARGANIICGDINLDAAQQLVSEIEQAGGTAKAVAVDVTDADQVKAMAQCAVDAFGAIDVMINNAGIMPLGFYADHEAGLSHWQRCIDINIKGILHGIVAVYDQMMAQQRGQVINISSIYGNFPVVGANVYGATKAAVNFLSESLRVEARGKIKVTTIKPTGVPATGLAAGIVNPAGVVGILGQNEAEFSEIMPKFAEGKIPENQLDPNEIDYIILDPEHIADQAIHVIDQPWGVSIGDITVRAAGDHYIL